MSESNSVSPLLDGFKLGNPISNHHGVCCCPAIKENSDIYDKLYAEYKILHDYFGQGGNDVMKRLKAIKGENE